MSFGGELQIDAKNSYFEMSTICMKSGNMPLIMVTITRHIFFFKWKDLSVAKDMNFHVMSKSPKLEKKS